MKYYKQIGFLVCLLLIISCFLPWAYYPDIHKSFTGFFSEEDLYGKPGKVFIFFAVASIILIVVDKVWAKRTLIFVAAFNLGYLIRTYILYTTCYRAVCPQKEYGLYLLIFSCVLLLAVSFFPNLKVKEEITKISEAHSE
jgi:hypothetical protein